LHYSICQNNVPVTPKRGSHIYDNPYNMAKFLLPFRLKSNIFNLIPES
jgi:hypothetical protein